MSEPVGNSPRANIPGNLPGNSHKEREEKKVEAEPREKIEKIIEGNVVTRKAPWWKRAARSLVADDAQNVGDYLFSDVIIPALKRTILEVISGGAERVLFGGSIHKRSGLGLGLGGNITSLRTGYDRMSGEPRRMMSRESRARHDFDEVVLDSRTEAVAVVEALIARVERYGAVSVSDLYDLVGVTGSFADLKWGWTDLRTADVRQSHGGFLLDLPQPEPLR